MAAACQADSGRSSCSGLVATAFCPRLRQERQGERDAQRVEGFEAFADVLLEFSEQELKTAEVSGELVEVTSDGGDKEEV